MLMVVFGAGASYDSVPARPPFDWPPERLPDRPPLANELFDDRPAFVKVMAQFPDCQPIVPLLRQVRGDVTVERVLQSLPAEALEYPQRHRQLAAVRYYLQCMLWGCESRWAGLARGITNHKTFLDHVERWRARGEPVCLVTFNYDTLLETALEAFGSSFTDLPSYVSGKEYKLFKLHGSTNWGRIVNTPVRDAEKKTNWEMAAYVIKNAASLDVGRHFVLSSDYPIGRLDELALFPALAIPVEEKSGFECPAEHVEALTALVPNVTKLLLVGWRASEKDFLTLFATNQRHEVRCFVVADELAHAKQTIANVQSGGISGAFEPFGGGFTHLVATRAADQFLRP